MTERRLASGIAGAAGLIAVMTLLARAAGFGRILVFADSVRAGGVGEIYQSVNAIPNVLFEVAAGGVLAAAAIPLIAAKLGAGDQEGADRTASVLLTWALAILVPTAVLVALLAEPAARWLVPPFDPQAHAVGTTLLRIFAVQIPLYGVGIILTGLLQAHRRFLAAALAPLLSSLAVLATYLWYASLVDGATAPSEVPSQAILVLGWGTTLGVVVLSLPLIGPALMTGWRWRPGFRMDPADLARTRGLAGAGVLALVAQQGAVLTTMWLGNRSGDSGAFPVYQYLQAVYLLPYAVLAVPVATSAFPALAERAGAGGDSTPTLSRALRAVAALTAVPAAVLIAVAPAVGAFFTALDARQGSAGASPAALAALAPALTAYAPGLVGLGLAALLTRALYVRGHPLQAGVAVAGGWVVAAVGPLVFVGPWRGPERTLWALGLWSSLGMTLTAVALLVLLRRSWGPESTQGLARTCRSLLLAMVGAIVVGDLVIRAMPLAGLGTSLVTGLVTGGAAFAAALAVLAVTERAMMVETIWRGRAKRHGGGA